MGLRQIAEADLGTILEDDVTGFGFPIVITDPAGSSGTGPLIGTPVDISQLIDPDTGQAVSGRLASCSIRISSLTAAGLEVPKGIADSKAKPWTARFDDINGNSRLYKVSQSNPDSALGVVVLLLEAYE